MTVKLSLQSLKHLEQWPASWRYILPGLLFLLVLGAGHWILLSGVVQKINVLESQEAVLKETLAIKQSQAVLLPLYRQQIDEITQTFSDLTMQLPSVAPTSQVLDEISKVGDAAGVSFGLIKPLPEVTHGFYAELPIQLMVSGSYRQLGQFICGLTALPRIVTVADFTVTPLIGDGGRAQNTLMMNLQVSAYRYNAGEQTHARP